jgi:hypothetical protein
MWMKPMVTVGESVGLALTSGGGSRMPYTKLFALCIGRPLPSMRTRHLRQREILDPIRRVFGIQHLANDFQIQHILAHGGRELMPVDGL